MYSTTTEFLFSTLSTDPLGIILCVTHDEWIACNWILTFNSFLILFLFLWNYRFDYILFPGELTGIISERDYISKIALLGRTSKETKVKEIATMSSKLVTVKVRFPSWSDLICFMPAQHICHSIWFGMPCSVFFSLTNFVYIGNYLCQLFVVNQQRTNLQLSYQIVSNY